MNVCLVSREYPPETGWGGIGTYTYELAHGLADLGHQVHVIAQSLNGPHDTQDGPITVHRISHKPLLPSMGALNEWRLRLEYSYHVGWMLRQLMKTHRIEIVEGPNFSGEGFVYSLRKQTPLVTRLHTPFAEAIRFSERPATVDATLSCGIEDATVLRSDLVTCSTGAHAQRVADAIGMDRARIQRIPLGIALPRLGEGASEIELPHPMILFVGRLEKRKGVHILMRAIPHVLKEVPEAHVLVIGRDPYRGGGSFTEQLERELTPRERERVHVLGYVPPERLGRYYRACDVFVAPSLYESFGLVYIEAMAYGKPVIGCAVGGVPEVVEDGVTGYLIPPEDPTQLARAMTRLLKDPLLREDIGRHGRKRVEERFTRERMAEDTVRAYRKLM